MTSAIPALETERLSLRAPQAADFATYRAFFADAAASHFYGGPLDEHRAWRVLATDVGHWALRDFGRWSMVERKTGRMIGSCGLWWPQGWPRSELTWWVMPEARRQGFALEASRAAIAFGYEQLEWAIVETHMLDANSAARNLALKLGGAKIARQTFPDGVERDVFAFLRELSSSVRS